MINLYRVYFNMSGTSGYKRNGPYCVVTTGVVEAAKLCEEAHPGSTVINVVHSGRVEHIDPRILEAN